MSKITIERMHESDFDAVAELFDQYRQFYKQGSDIKSAQAFLDTRLKHKEILIFTAKIGADVAGFANIYPTYSSVQMKPVWTLNDLFVAKNHRRQGVAETLIKALHDQAHQQGIAHMQLETAEDNTAAQKCYEQTHWQRSDYLTYTLDTGSKQ